MGDSRYPSNVTRSASASSSISTTAASIPSTDVPDINPTTITAQLVGRPPPPQYRVALPQRDEALGERKQITLLIVQVPVEPANLIVLTIRIVVAVLGAPELVTAEQHRHALR